MKKSFLVVFILTILLSFSHSRIIVEDSKLSDDGKTLYLVLLNNGDHPESYIKIDVNYGGKTYSQDIWRSVILNPGERYPISLYIGEDISLQNYDIIITSEKTNRRKPRVEVYNVRMHPLFDFENRDASYYYGWWELKFDYLNPENYPQYGFEYGVAVYGDNGELVYADETNYGAYTLNPQESYTSETYIVIGENTPRNPKVILFVSSEPPLGGVEGRINYELIRNADEYKFYLRDGNVVYYSHDPTIGKDGYFSINSILGDKNLFFPGNYSLVFEIKEGNDTIYISKDVTIEPGELTFVDLTDYHSGAFYCYAYDKDTNKPLENAFVYLYKEGKKRYQKLTGADGDCSFYNIFPGEYEMKISKANYYPISKKVKALASSTILRYDIPAQKISNDSYASIYIKGNEKTVVGKNENYSVVVEKYGNIKRIEVFIKTPVKPDYYENKNGECVYKADEGGLECYVISKGESKEMFEIPLQLRFKNTGDYKIKAVLVVGEGEDSTNEDNEYALGVNVNPLIIKGLVMTFSGSLMSFSSVPLYIKEVPITLFLGNKKYVTYSDSKGSYMFIINETNTTNGKIKVELKDKNNTIKVVDKLKYNGKTVYLETKEIDFSKKENYVFNIVFNTYFKHLKPGLNGIVLEDSALFYANLYDAMNFGRTILGKKYDYSLPVIAEINSNYGCSTCYNRGKIYVKKGADTSKLSPDAPMNREYHEFGHYFSQDANMLGGDNKIQSSGVNHAGISNQDSTDSFVEGFAEFYSLMVSRRPIYRWAGGATNLEKNYHAWSSSTPIEEFLVASLLWDFVDSSRDSQKIGNVSYHDNIRVSYRDLLKAMDDASVKNVRTLYVKLKKSFGNRDGDKDGIDDVDELFIMHYFFSDSNKNNAYDKGERIGYADFWKKSNSSTTPRSDLEPVNGTGLIIKDYDKVLVEVIFKNSSYNYEYVDYVNNGMIYIYVPYDAEKAIVRALVPSKSVVYEINPGEYWEKVAKAQKEGRETFASANFVVRDVYIPPVEEFHINRSNGMLYFDWKSNYDVVIIRSIGKATTPYDGEVIFKGRGNSTKAVDFDEVDYTYTIFNINGNEFSKGVSFNVKEDRIEKEGEKTGDSLSTLFYPLVFIILIVVFYLAYKRFNKKEK